MNVAKEDILVSVARLIADRDITIAEFYEALGCDLEAQRINADQQISELEGIFKGWEIAWEKAVNRDNGQDQ